MRSAGTRAGVHALEADDARRFSNELFCSAPQLTRTALGGSDAPIGDPIKHANELGNAFARIDMAFLSARIWSPGLAAVVLASCSRAPATEEPLFRDAVSNTRGVLPGAGVAFDTTTSSDGNGSMKISVADSSTVRLYQLGDVDAENARLIYRARLRTAGVQGQVYLEVWCRFPGLGEFFSRALQAPLTGSTEWTVQETPFLLEPGQNPDQVALNIVVTGRGTVWVDDVALLKAPR